MSPKLLNVLLLLIPVVMYYGFIEPMITGNPGMVWTPSNSIKGLQATNVQYINAANIVSTITMDMKKVNKDYLDISTSTIEKVGIMLPDTIDIFKLRKEVVSIADKVGVSIADPAITENPRNTDQSVQSYLITFALKAKYPKIKELLQEYEKNMRFYSVESMTIKIKDKKGLSAEELLSFDSETLDVEISYTVASLKK